MSRPADILDVHIAGKPAGELRQLPGGRLSFSYHEQWINGRAEIPLSLSMPTIRRTYEGKVVEAFLWGLLPDNEEILAGWVRRFQVSARNPLALLKHVGRDCAGAVEFLPHGEPASSDDDVLFLTEEEVGERLRELRKDAAATRRIGDPGQFTLAGAQPKTALYFDSDSGRWGIPVGNVPTTHIIKPPMPHLNGYAENEHFCLRLARKLGLDVAQSQVLEFAGEKALVVERYDRRRVNGRIIRIHQEDMCQALSVMPTGKYENQGGPGIAAISTRVLPASQDPVRERQTFLAAVIFNWIIGGTDAHAKNYSMLLGPKADARLAPLYDVSSILPHLGEAGIEAQLNDLKLSMRVDKVYSIEEIMPRDWERCATSAKVGREFTLGTIRHQLAVIPDVAADCDRDLRMDGITHEIVVRLVDAISRRVNCLASFYGAEIAAD
ncbi:MULTISPECIES: type II toxin-antitoxin system HipA family toxin [unclassified Aminobacter]|uniref:type II toxin-antitoxin system HipA family toxin n=1 Tax=unclassified Aminobacter TaxID=2644704 RepID=UPI0004B9A582|nr:MULTISPECIES: type II toxin-antitoxin system HipA family toxin [unclassified Aminobacter]TWH32217.1 serine/threonine-protein kinase HipA [Aminobacter sp. J15]